MANSDSEMDFVDRSSSDSEIVESNSSDNVDFDDISSESAEEMLNDSDNDFEEEVKKSGTKHSAWGNKKKNFYGGVDQREDAEQLEQEEAKILKEEELETVKQDDFEVSSDEEDEDDEKYKQELGLIEGTEHISRDLSKLSKDELKQIVKSESPELIVMLREIQTKVNDLRNEFKVFKKTIEKDERLTKDGVSFIELKHSLMANYCLLISMYLLLKAEGNDVREHPVLKQLVRTKSMLEKLAPIEALLKPQLDQLASTTKTTNAGNPLSFAANVDNFDVDLSEEEEGEQESTQSVLKNEAFKAQKLLAVQYNEDNNRNERKREQLKKKLQTNSLLQDLQEEYSERPQEVKMNSTGDAELDLEEKERRRFEENNFTRLTLSRKDRKRREAAERNLSRGKGLDDLLNTDGNLDALMKDIDEDMDTRKDQDDLDLYQDDGLYEEVFNEKLQKKKQQRQQKKEMEKDDELMVNDDFLLPEGEARKATYKILKNRGLTAHRKKENRNPRVKRRVKYEKAVKRRKGQIAPMRTDQGMYLGERTGIRSDITKSRKMN